MAFDGTRIDEDMIGEFIQLDVVKEREVYLIAILALSGDEAWYVNILSIKRENPLYINCASSALRTARGD